MRNPEEYQASPAVKMGRTPIRHSGDAFFIGSALKEAIMARGLLARYLNLVIFSDKPNTLPSLFFQIVFHADVSPLLGGGRRNCPCPVLQAVLYSTPREAAC